MKTCARCRESKDESSFYHLKRRGKLVPRPYCKVCHGTISMEWFALHPEKKREITQRCRARGISPEMRQANLAREYADRKRNPHKRSARLAIQRAVAGGRVVKPTTCEFCTNPVQEAHHDDYSKQLEVLWLCAVCHRARHKHLEDIKMRLLGVMEIAQ